MSLLSVAGFTNVGYRLHARDHEPVTADMTGKTVLVTGATGGLGKAAARSLAALGAQTIIVGRDREKLAGAQREIPGDVIGYQADLSLLSEVRRIADLILSREERLDVLVNNVGVLLPTRQVTEEGLEATFATDLAGHFLLTNLLMERLATCAPSRVVNVTSGGMYSERIRPDDLQFERREYRGAAAYARAKRGQVILTEMWAERIGDRGVTFNAMHPGWAKTPGVARSLPKFHKVMRPLLRTVEQGADTIVWLAADPAPASITGELWFDRKRVPKHLVDRTRETSEDRIALWDALRAVTASEPALGTRS